ncbi:putative hydro-lyase [Roseibium algae]|uniref:Putative hydro-lyase V6575_16545 n=1 Tax=Roseibium algae TaxID=3123038 RepID=A0ABU8TNF3_9HYPH
MKFPDLCNLDSETVRQTIRSGGYFGHTAGLAQGLLQCNLAILPKDLADDFLSYCKANPKSCPLAGYSAPGDPHIARLGQDVDIRTDAPNYNVYRNGVLAEQITDLTPIWQDDFVAFAIGCSFTFETALLKAGFTLRHIEQNITVPMYRSSIQTTPSRCFKGDTVVSMRPLPIARVDEARDICGAYPLAHGTPIHIGDPASIGIYDITTPQWGDPVAIKDDEVPVFWACGVTPQVAIMEARPVIAITHSPGAMLITQVAETTAPIFPYQDPK